MIGNSWSEVQCHFVDQIDPSILILFHQHDCTMMMIPCLDLLPSCLLSFPSMNFSLLLLSLLSHESQANRLPESGSFLLRGNSGIYHWVFMWSRMVSVNEKKRSPIRTVVYTRIWLLLIILCSSRLICRFEQMITVILLPFLLSLVDDLVFFSPSFAVLGSAVCLFIWLPFWLMRSVLYSLSYHTIFSLLLAFRYERTDEGS